ncbi:hypothetical protein [Salinibacterium sp. ZJ450]|uniref:hypothetical protein n=1 Tax=Salinibacterium sp. ZJ450 TaxID=2708338 RepID=UPI0014248C0D|nr:hypothetical protein [Salinibacterium sp. ZJ450]
MAEIEIPARLASALRTMLARADADPAGRDSADHWRRARDRWVDVVDPMNRMLAPEQAVELLTFLADSVPSAESRMSRVEWHAAVDDIAPQLIGLSG